MYGLYVPIPIAIRHTTNHRLLSVSFFVGIYLFLLTAIAGPCAAAFETKSVSIPDRWAVDYTTSVLWGVGGGATPLTYTLAPQIVSVLCPPSSQRAFAGGTLIMRARLSLLLEPIINGPETHFIGTAAAGDLEWRNAAGDFALFFAAGGGFGWMNSRGYEVQGAQGQDFNLNWLLHAGLRIRTRSDWRWSTGLYFQHISNRGLDKVNPGLNALGPSFGLSRKF